MFNIAKTACFHPNIQLTNYLNFMLAPGFIYIIYLYHWFISFTCIIYFYHLYVSFICIIFSNVSVIRPKWIPSSLVFLDSQEFDDFGQPPPVHILYPRPSFNNAKRFYKTKDKINILLFVSSSLIFLHSSYLNNVT